MGLSGTNLPGNKVNSKNIYYETFLANFDLFLKKVSCDFYCFSLSLFLKTKFHNICKLLSFFSFFFPPNIRTSGKNIIFDDKKINNSFYKNKKLFKIYDVDVDKILISKKEPYGKTCSFKYFPGYNDDDVIRPLCIKLPQMIEYVKHFNSNKTMSFKVSDKKYAKIWEKVSILMNIEFVNLFMVIMINT